MVAIFVLTMFLFFLSVDLIVLKIQGNYHPAFAPSLTQFEFSLFDKNTFNIPPNIFFSKGHTWVKKDEIGLVQIGIDEFAMMALGSLSILDCAPIGKELKRGEVIFEGAYGNKTVKFLSPINGTVNAVNTNIVGKKISNPYENWGVQLLSNDPLENQEMILSGKEATKWMKKEIIKLKSFIDVHSPKIELAGATMFDGGSLSNDIISSLSEQSANDFEIKFLSL